jgi:hypothetical protein
MAYASTPALREYNRNYMANWRALHPEKAREAVRNWQLKNPERVRENARAWRANWTPEQREARLAKQRERTFFRRYGLTYADYEALLAKQDNRCALCPRTPDQERYKKLNVDHCHSTGRIRGLLCTPCNHALGLLGDSADSLRKAVEYVACQI